MFFWICLCKHIDVASVRYTNSIRPEGLVEIVDCYSSRCRCRGHGSTLAMRFNDDQLNKSQSTGRSKSTAFFSDSTINLTNCCRLSCQTWVSVLACSSNVVLATRTDICKSCAWDRSENDSNLLSEQTQRRSQMRCTATQTNVVCQGMSINDYADQQRHPKERLSALNDPDLTLSGSELLLKSEHGSFDSLWANAKVHRQAWGEGSH